jgi:L-rhamnose mutarotase
MEKAQIENLKTGCVKIKIKDGTILKVYEWKEYLNTHKNEVLESLRQEGVFVESVFLDKQGDNNYLIYYMKFKDQKEAQTAFAKSDLNIDKYHAQFKKEVWEARQQLELLVDFVNVSI